ncbi:MAG: hypothetical protein ILP02_03475 [Clostridia bacterium]|nr:hypothetical protein [Clostridia bacterium]
MQPNFKDFRYLLGDIIVLYQFVEHDIKMIVAALMNGKFEDAYEKVLTDQDYMGLGKSIKALKQIEYEKKDRYFSKSDYDLLFDIASRRNHYCHQTALEFGYVDDFESSPQFFKEFETLEKDRDYLRKIQPVTEKIRLHILGKQGVLK